MTSTLSTRVTVERDAITQSMSLILENMSEEMQQQLDQWIPEIEEYATQSIAQLTNLQLSTRRPELIAAAVIYNGFLEFEGRTRVRVRTPFLAKTLGLTLCSINQVYHRLFDTKVHVFTHRVECIKMSSDNLTDLVIEVVDSLQNALEDKTSRTTEWFASVQSDAISMVSSLTEAQRTSYDADVIAAAAVFGAMQRQQTREIVHVAQKDIALTCRYSAAMLSKVWLEFFSEGSISSAVQTKER